MEAILSCQCQCALLGLPESSLHDKPAPISTDTPGLMAEDQRLVPRGSCLSWIKKSGRQDLNLRHPAPKAGALPNCATPRTARKRQLPA